MTHRLALLACLGLATLAASSGCGTYVGDVIVDESTDAPGDDTATAFDDVGAPDTDADVDPPPPPTVTISEPHDVTACVGSDATRPSEIGVQVTHWTVAAAGTCAGKPNCGPVYVTIDGDDCNQTGLPYNTVITGVPRNEGSMLLVRCKSGPEGTKTVRVELHDDDGSAHVPLTFDARTIQFKACTGT